MMTNENGNVVAVGYFVGMDYRRQIDNYIMTLKFSKNGTKNDYLFGNVCIQTVTMPSNTFGAFILCKFQLCSIDRPIAIEFEHKGDNYWAPVSVKAVKEDDPEEFKKVTAEDARFMMDRHNSERVKNNITWCQTRAEHGEAYEPSERVIPDKNIKGYSVVRQYGIKTALVSNGNNFNYYLERG